jgi:hypothetical protein
MLRGNILLFAAGGGDMLLQEDAECHGFMFITPDEEELLATHRASPMTQVGMDTESRLAGHATQESVIGQLRASCDLSL